MRELGPLNELILTISIKSVAAMSYEDDAPMKASSHIARDHPFSAFTLIELLVVVVLLMIILSLFPVAILKDKPKAQRIACVNNLKQVGLSFSLWTGDNSDKYPMAASTNLGGTMEWITAGTVYPHFAALSNQLGTPKILACPSDDRDRATNFTFLSDSNISYFVCLNATNKANPQMWLSGDRNLTNGAALFQGVLTVPTHSPVGWTEKLHNLQGNVALADGSVQQVTSAKLRELLRSQSNSPLRLAKPQ